MNPHPAWCNGPHRSQLAAFHSSHFCHLPIPPVMNAFFSPCGTERMRATTASLNSSNHLEPQSKNQGRDGCLAYRLPSLRVRGTSGPRNPPDGGLGVGDNGNRTSRIHQPPEITRRNAWSSSPTAARAKPTGAEMVYLKQPSCFRPFRNGFDRYRRAGDLRAG